MSDDDDYMSDKFLAGLTDGPSLIQNHAKKRNVKIEQKRVENIKRQHLERKSANNNEQQLQESLKRPINSENKGFQLLAKMGYKVGQALGKQTEETAATALIEPIGISIKSDRGGLGREAALRELAEKRYQFRLQRMRKLTDDSLSAEEFRKRANLKAEERFMVGALKRCQLTCENIDVEHKVEPEVVWFWPQRPTETIDKNEEVIEADDATPDEDFTTAEKLEMLTSYLRTAYNFCFWCGINYKDPEDILTNCPGLTRDEH